MDCKTERQGHKQVDLLSAGCFCSAGEVKAQGSPCCLFCCGLEGVSSSSLQLQYSHRTHNTFLSHASLSYIKHIAVKPCGISDANMNIGIVKAICT